MGKKRKELSQEEIWDDSGLIESWNQSYEEYKQYHSIHARGERVKDVLAAAEDAEAAETSGPDVPAANGATITEGKDEAMGDGDDAPLNEATIQSDNTPRDNERNQAVEVPLSQDHIVQEAGPVRPVALPGGAKSVAQTAVSESTNDPGLKDLMMSWYWTGYYTGLYEGQRATKFVGEEQNAKNLAA